MFYALFLCIFASYIYPSLGHRESYEGTFSRETVSSPDSYDSACETALSCVYSPDEEAKHMVIPYIRQLLIEEEGSPWQEDRRYMHAIRLAQGTHSSDSLKEILKIRELVLNASFIALREKENALAEKRRQLIEQEKELHKKMSKKRSYILSVISSLTSALVAGITAYYSKK